MKKLLFIPALAGVVSLLAPSTASAALTCPVRSSIFGTVTAVHPNELTLLAQPSEFGRIGHIHVMSNGTHVNANGQPLRTGVFAGVFGCLQPDHRAFMAEDISLASSEEAYEQQYNQQEHTVTIDGRVDSVQNGHFLLDANGGHGDTWVYTTQPVNVRPGSFVTVTGSFRPRDNGFVASTVNVTRT